MDGGNGSDIGSVEQYGHAIGGAHTDPESGAERDKGIGLRELPRRVLGPYHPDVTGMCLAWQQNRKREC